ncbi:MAG: class I SAM-dependent methyltransferase [Betaproteobacteria bacterium]|nr:class I SAM-dependent methyltransferase [Betaproteobacteria bacterium]MDE2003508.1 class I SAM-dependent methyltransferase [Betaproteobacteria bacterium]MDE2360485.1 class I SAM-dependent methyltransferase [Betaproteobacteria bacterium]
MPMIPADLPPSPWVARHAHLVPAGAQVLDLAAGGGRHSRLFAARAAKVTAVDRDASALAALEGLAGVRTHCADLEAGPWPFADRSFDAIVVTNYLHRPLFDTVLSALAPDGVLLYETFAAGNERHGRPSSPDFLLRPGELLECVRGRLTVVAFEQGEIGSPRPAVVQRIAALGKARRWPPLLAP